jgi:hypothetical protein
MSPNITWGGEGVSKNVTQQFLLVISLVKVNKKLLLCHTRGGGGKGEAKCHQISHRGRGV